MKRGAAILLALAAFLAASIGPASAITNGTTDGNGHPNVGALVAAFGGPGQKDLLCTGTLISPTVFLTASHCTIYLESIGVTDVWVTFDPQFNGSSTLHHGIYHTNPAYGHDMAHLNDVAVVVLDAAVVGITPAQLPAAGLFDEMAPKNGLKGQKFTAVGYGDQDRQNGGGPPAFAFDGARRVSTSAFRALSGNWLRLSQNPSTGDGGTCYGDSGGPNFLGTSNVVAAVTVTGDAACRATNVVFRLDTPAARDFLGDYVTLP
jgi:hypothetical protein